MTKLMTLAALTLILSPAVAAAEQAPLAGDVLVLRHALLVGGRDANSVPFTGEARSGEELATYLAEWEPGRETEEIRELFALEGLSEVVRQALVLPAEGGQSSSVYVTDGVGFEVSFDVRPYEEEAISAKVEIRRNGALLAAPNVTTALGERAILSMTDGPEAPFLFLVVEAERVPHESLRKRGLRYAWRKDVKTVDGEVTAPRAIQKAPPKYTEEARKERIQGVVVLRLVIDETGAVSDVEVLKGLPLGLTETAIAAVEQWRFEPATYQGEPVSVLYNITINFRLEKGKKPAAPAD